MPDPDDEKGGSQVVPDKPGTQDSRTSDHEQDREGAPETAAERDKPDSF